MLCDTCKRIPYDFFIQRGSFEHGTLGAIKESAEAGCGFCGLINDSFYLQMCRGAVREIAYRTVNENVTLYTDGSVRNGTQQLQLIYQDDLGPHNGYKRSPLPVPMWDFLLDVAESWERNCRENHEECKRDSGTTKPSLPSRLIQFDIEQDDSIPKLVSTSELEQDEIKYVTLSHRWGQPDSMSSTTVSNIQTRLSEIRDLPLTFRQAVSIARKLKIAYLWIDSICIIQDDPSDKSREIARMANIYSNSFCNIVASTASDPTEGCYNPEKAQSVAGHILEFPRQNEVFTRRVFFVRADRAAEELSTGIESGVLHSRGWLVQERHLPRRAVLFTPQCVMWECQKSRIIREYPDSERVFATMERVTQQESRHESSAASNFWKIMNSPNGQRAIYWEWLKLAAEYSGKRLTVASDKLPAIGGLASSMQELTGDEYVAGLWRRDLVRSLCWMQPIKQQLDHLPGCEVNTDRGWEMTTPYRAPSWSWANLDLVVTYPEFDEFGEFMSKLETAASPEILEVTAESATADKFGQVSSASIRLKAFTVVVNPFRPLEGSVIVLPIESPVYQQEGLKRVRIYNRYGQPIAKLVLERQNWTLGIVPDKHSNMSIKCVLLWNFDDKHVNVLDDNNLTWSCKLIGLALRPVQEEPKKYERIGMMFWRLEEGAQLFEDEGVEEELTII
ncbi:HET-domain-containing protein [Rhizodiscina lignyota]|uniref:HET-domain-containing protein n=1 Tax=Rhizodiscina lignyota TaxID=1504668 RepID=A0A9P4M1E3_9PEZI|nr:HET-domain-containing protein [Rhizodiscina lignyota]